MSKTRAVLYHATKAHFLLIGNPGGPPQAPSNAKKPPGGVSKSSRASTDAVMLMMTVHHRRGHCRFPIGPIRSPQRRPHTPDVKLIGSSTMYPEIAMLDTPLQTFLSSRTLCGWLPVCIPIICCIRVHNFLIRLYTSRAPRNFEPHPHRP